MSPARASHNVDNFRNIMLCVFVHTHVYVYICTSVCCCIPPSVYVCISLSVYIHTYTHTYIHTCIHTYIMTYVCIYIYFHICIHTHVYIYIHLFSSFKGVLEAYGAPGLVSRLQHRGHQSMQLATSARVAAAMFQGVSGERFSGKHRPAGLFALPVSRVRKSCL